MTIDKDSIGTPGPSDYEPKSEFNSRKGVVIG